MNTTSTADLPTMLVREDEARSPLRVKLELDANQCAALAARFDVPDVHAFVVKAIVTRQKGRQLRVEGSLVATFSYMCGVTVQPFEAVMEEDFNQVFADNTSRRSKEDVITFDPMAELDAEPLHDGAADVAELAYQTFATALDPFPRHPNAVLSGVLSEEEAEQMAQDDEGKPASPFEVLKVLKH